jgi:hypothetical protein
MLGLARVWQHRDAIQYAREDDLADRINRTLTGEAFAPGDDYTA